MVGKNIYTSEELYFAEDTLKKNPELEEKITEYWLRFNSREYNAKPLEEQAKDLHEFYEEEGLLVHPADLGAMGITIACKIRDEYEAFKARPLVKVDCYYLTREKRKLDYGDIIGTFLNCLLKKYDEKKADKFTEDNVFYYVCSGKEFLNCIKHTENIDLHMQKLKK